MDQLGEQVQDVFKSVFGDPELELREEMTAADVDGWDSVMHLNLIIAIEKRFSIRFANAEIARLNADGQNVGDLIALVRRKTS